jgi:uncharacterized repeat protein (TIGR03943 family)
VTVAGATIVLLSGAVVLRLTVTGAYRWYVRPGMGPWLAVAGTVVILLGAVSLLRALRRAPTEDAHGHTAGDRAGWLLLAPIAALLLVAPPTLGSFGVDRAATVDVRSGPAIFDPLPTGGGPVPMSLLEYGQRAFEHDGASLADATVRLTGFVASVESDGFRLARYRIACCAADAAPVVVRVVGVLEGVPSLDEWVSVTGTFRASTGPIAELVAMTVRPSPTPDEPFE